MIIGLLISLPSASKEDVEKVKEISLANQRQLRELTEKTGEIFDLIEKKIN